MLALILFLSFLASILYTGFIAGGAGGTRYSSRFQLSRIGSRKQLLRELLPCIRALFGNSEHPELEQREGEFRDLEFAELIVYHFDLSLPELYEIKQEPKLLAPLVDIIKHMRENYFDALNSWVHREELLQKYGILTAIWNAKIPEAYVNREFPFKNIMAPTVACSWSRVVNENPALTSTQEFIRHMNSAKNLYLLWFSDFRKNGAESALKILENHLFTQDVLNLERLSGEARKVAYDELISIVDPPIDPPLEPGGSPPSFPRFNEFPAEIQTNIWRQSFEPRTIEIQGGYPVLFTGREDDGDFHPRFEHLVEFRKFKPNPGLRAFQQIEKSGMKAGTVLKNFLIQCEAQEKAQEERYRRKAYEELQQLDDYVIEEAEKELIGQMAYTDSAEDLRYITGDTSGNTTPRKLQFWSPALPPASLHVNFFSRKETLRYYSAGFNNPKSEGPKIYINYDIDMVLITKETWASHDFYKSTSSRWIKPWWDGLALFSQETRDQLQRVSIDRTLFHDAVTETPDTLKDIFPNLSLLNQVVPTRQPIYYELVQSYLVHAAYNQQFPGHSNQYFQNPWKRYLDRMFWIPGKDQVGNNENGSWLRGEQPTPQEATRYPGVVPINKDFLLKLQRAPITFIPYGADFQRIVHPGVVDLLVHTVRIVRGINADERLLVPDVNHMRIPLFWDFQGIMMDWQGQGQLGVDDMVWREALQETVRIRMQMDAFNIHLETVPLQGPRV